MGYCRFFRLYRLSGLDSLRSCRRNDLRFSWDGLWYSFNRFYGAERLCGFRFSGRCRFRSFSRGVYFGYRVREEVYSLLVGQPGNIYVVRADCFLRARLLHVLFFAAAVRDMRCAEPFYRLLRDIQVVGLRFGEGGFLGGGDLLHCRGCLHPNGLFRRGDCLLFLAGEKLLRVVVQRV